MTNLKELQIKLQKSKWWILFILSLVLLIFGLTISIVFYCVLRDSNYTLADSTHKVSISETGNIGDFVGGVVGTVLSFASVILLILTLTVQRDQNKLDRFGQTFYEMLHIHNDNVTSMKLKDVDNTTGRDVFRNLLLIMSIYMILFMVVSRILEVLYHYQGKIGKKRKPY